MEVPHPGILQNYPTVPGPTISNMPQIHSPINLSTENDGDYDQETGSDMNQGQMGDRAGSKRERPSRSQKKDERQKVSRACDSCKAKKVRCAGTQPCNRCIKQSLRCEYDAEHRRGKPAPPEPALLNDNVGEKTATFSPVPKSHRRRLRQKVIQQAPRAVDRSIASNELRRSAGSSQEPEETRFEGDYIGPTSGIAFLHRAQRRFQQDFAGTMSSDVDGQSSVHASVFSFGDGWVPDYSTSELVFPSKNQANHLLDRYFDFAMPTYRFLHRVSAERWLENICEENENVNLQGTNLSSAKSAIVLLILATAKLYGEDAAGLLHNGEAKDFEESGILFAEAERKLSRETGPVRLESVQARLAQCIYLLASSRINQAWYIFGTATQMILALGLHRKRFSQSSGVTSGAIEIECRKRVFWSAYTLDRYLSVILGRPRIFRDEDVDQHLPDRLNDADLTPTGAKARSTYNQSVSHGPVFHAKLAKIIGGISSDLYPTNRTADFKWAESAERWTSELKAWKESLPPFLEPAKVDPSILVPIVQRQSTVLRLAYAHALILANRPSLLNNFADLSRLQSLPQGEPEGSLKECIDAAILVVDTVNGFIEEGKMCKAFWFTHYISFCAIAALYVYTIQQSIPRQQSSTLPTSKGHYFPPTNHFEAAEKCQKSIAETTAKTSPFRRYNIILDELKREVLHRLGLASANQSGGGNASNEQPIRHEMHRPFMDSSGGTPSMIPNNAGAYPMDFGIPPDGSFQLRNTQPLNPRIYGQGNTEFDFGSSHVTPARIFDESILDFGLFGPQVELMGWSEFDSCAITWPDALECLTQELDCEVQHARF